MSSPPQFSKLGKKVKDLFKKEYDFGYTVKTTNKASQGLKFESAGTDNGGGISGYTKANYSNADFGKVEVQLHSAGRDADTNAKVTLNKLVKNLELSITGNSAPDVKIEAIYTMDKVAATVTHATNIESGKNKIGAQASVSLADGIVVGGDIGIGASKNDAFGIVAYNAGVEYTAKDFIATVTTASKFDILNLSYFHKLNSDITLGASAAVSIKDDSKRTLAVGSTFKVDDSTSFKAKVDLNGAAGFSLCHVLSDPRMKFNFAQTFNVLDSKAAKKFGLGLTFGDF